MLFTTMLTNLVRNFLNFQEVSEKKEKNQLRDLKTSVMFVEPDTDQNLRNRKD